MEKEEHIILWILVLGSALFVSLIYNTQLLYKVVGARTMLLDYYFIEFALFFTVPVIIGIITLFLLKRRRLIIPWWITALTTLAFSLAIKYLFAQERPFEVYDDIVALTTESTSYSFPSVRTAVTFSAMPLLAKYYPKLFPFWLIFGLLVAFSRVYIGVHFVGDVIGGVLVGYLIGKMILLTAERRNKL